MKQSAEHIQVAALPIQVRAGTAKVLLVQTRSGRWTPPKGWPVPGISHHEAAAREAFEEGGVSGTIRSEPLGSMTYRKRLGCGRKVDCKATVFPLDVSHVARNWPEKRRRRRKWVTLDAAIDVMGLTSS